MSILRCLVTVLLSAMVAASCLAQSTLDPLDPLAQLLPEPQAASERGLSWFTTVTGSHDSPSGWSSIMDSSMRYDFSNVFGVYLGMPYYMTQNVYKPTVYGSSSIK